MFQLSVVSVPVVDLFKGQEFYENSVGFRFVREGDRGTLHGFILMMPPAGTAGISLVQASEKIPAGSAQGLMLQTLDLNRVVQKLGANGIAMKEPTAVSWGRFSNFTDPDGNGWVIAEPNFDV